MRNVNKWKLFAWVVGFVLVTGAVGRAQDKTDLVPLKIQVVISRWQGEKKISSMPYTLTVNTPMATTAGPQRQGRANMRMGAKIPVMMMTVTGPATTPDGKPVPQVGPIQYQDVGTNIDCFATQFEGGRFSIDLTIDDTSVYDDQTKREQPSFRSFRASDSMMLKDGQSAQFTAATDKVSGEVTRVDVTLTVVK